MQKRATRAGVIAATLIGGAWGGLLAFEWPAPFTESGEVSQTPRTIRREDFMPAPMKPKADGREFFFTRAIYSGGSWATDYPKADQQFLTIIDRLVDLDA